MNQPDRDDLKDKAHLYRGLSELPSAHTDPPASVVGPTGLREASDAASVDPAAPSQATRRAAGPAGEELSYDNPRPKSRGGGVKLLLGAGALAGAALAYLFLRFGLGPGGAGYIGTSPGDNHAAPNPRAPVEATAPATAPTTSPALAPIPVPATAPAIPLHLTITGETYHVGSADGREVSLNDAVGLAKTAKPLSPVFIDLNDSSRAAAEDHLRSAFEQQQIPIIWTRDGKPVTGDLPAPGRLGGDAGGSK